VDQVAHLAAAQADQIQFYQQSHQLVVDMVLGMYLLVAMVDQVAVATMQTQVDQVQPIRDLLAATELLRHHFHKAVAVALDQ
jgi:hypothetical protein